MKDGTKYALAGLATSALLLTPLTGLAEPLADAITGGKASGNVRLRYEQVDQDNALKDADALTIRTRLGYQTGTLAGFSGFVEFEDSRTVAGVDDYNDTQGKNTDTSVVADPETTELDQAYLQYQFEAVTAKLGRQVIVYDNQRFVGHVGWRQDRQTFDAFRVNYIAIPDLSIDYAYLDQRNRIFAQERDLPANDHLLNVGYQTPVGKLSGYGYFLEVDDNTDNALNTLGLRFSGSQALSEVTLSYGLEYATQEADNGATTFDADYYKLDAGIGVMGMTLGLAYEVLGSDDGNYGFSTPLATLHAHNGWADQFLGTPAVGLTDLIISVKGALASGTWAVAYHDFDADDAQPGVSDLGSEIDLAFTVPIAEHYTAGIKYAAYSAGDVSAGKVDTDKLWLTLSAAF